MQTQKKYDFLINQIKEVAIGNRGFVSVTKKTAASAGTTQNQILVIAKTLNLKFDVHGKYGFCVYK